MGAWRLDCITRKVGASKEGELSSGSKEYKGKWKWRESKRKRRVH